MNKYSTEFLPKYMAHAKNPLMQKVGVQGLAVGHIQRYPFGCIRLQPVPLYTDISLTLEIPTVKGVRL